MNLEQLRQKYIEKGLTAANVSATICQDIILNKISKSNFNKNVTIKGGVVMYGISNDKRRATRDIDLDFIKYSLDDKSIELFINKLNLVHDGIKIEIDGNITKLHHQDYDGKRVSIKLSDEYGFAISTKLDIGVNNLFDIEQEEFCFELDVINKKAVLLINSKEQIICEKLKSLLKFGIRSTRYKDIFDFYYLINYTKIDKDKLIELINLLIIEDNIMREKNIYDVLTDLKSILKNKEYIRNLNDARNNWLGIPVSQVVDNIISYFESLELVNV